MKNNLVQHWSQTPKVRQMTFPTSVRLRPAVDSHIQEILAEYPHLTQTQVINDLLEDSLERLNKIIT